MLRQIGNNLIQRRTLFSSISLDIYPCLHIRFITTDQKSFMISYLINSCELSQQKAISASKQVHFDSSTNPDSVLTLLRDNGFSNSHISKIVASCPILLISKVDKTLKPKFDYFNSKGLSGAELTKVLCKNPNVLGSSLEKTIIPSISLLESIVGTREKVLAMLKRSMNVLPRIKTVESNIALLRSHGVPMSNIQKLLVSQPRALLRNPSRFSEDVEEVMKMKFDPSRQVFLAAIQVLSAMSRSSLDAKFCLYKSWGWSEDELQGAFRKHPFCMMLSKENIMSTMDYFVKKLGYAPSSIAEQPSVLLYSCEKRIIPRCSAMQILIKNGKVAQSIALGTLLQMPEDVFLEKYISRFEKEVPELLRAYKGEGKRNG